ncbi:MAG: MFS transporter [Betaproteobacteria bacterium]|nr:MFS transporter [Betaproteobacteria bacterium]
MALSSPTARQDLQFSASEHPFRWAILAGLWLLYFCFGITTTSLAPLVQPITRDLGISHSAMGAVLGAWPLVYIAAAIPSGALMDRLGPRRTLFLAMLVISLSAVLRGMAETHLALFIAVATFGLGGPLVSIGAPKLVSLWFEGKERGLAMGIYITGPSLGAVAALSMTNSVFMPFFDGDWRRVLSAYALLTLAAALVWLAVSGYPASRAMEKKVASEPRVGQLEVFAKLIAQRPVQLIMAMSVCMFFVTHGLANWLAEILRAGGMTAAAAGYWASIPMVIGIASALLIPRLATPSRRTAILAGLIVTAGAATLLLQSDSGPLLAIALVCHGIVRGAMTTVTVLLLMETPGVGSRHTGAASGLFFSAAEMGGVLGPLSIGVLHDASGNFASALFALTAACALLLVLLGLLHRTGKQ